MMTREPTQAEFLTFLRAQAATSPNDRATAMSLDQVEMMDADEWEIHKANLINQMMVTRLLREPVLTH